MDWSSTPRRTALRRAAFVEPCIPTMTREPPTGPAWVHEIKYDGFRLMVWRDGERVRLFTRRGFDWTRRHPWIVHSVRRLPVERFLIDVEAVACGEDGVADFEKLQSRQHDGSAFLYGFDLLVVDGTDIRRLRLDERRGKLAQLLAQPDGIRFSESLDGDGAVMFAHACRMGLEGIVSKRRDAPYRSGRSKAWLKTKNPAAPGVLRFRQDDA